MEESLKKWIKLRDKLWRDTLQKHWLFSVECFHNEKTDVSHCSCGWSSDSQPTVGEAVAEWIKHVESIVTISKFGKHNGRR